MKTETVRFAGAGPGAADLVTIRAKEAVRNADVIVYAGSLVNEEILRYASPQTALYDSSGMTLDDILQSMIEAARSGKKVLRLHTGDPAVYGAIAEQIRELKKADVPFEVIPGVSSAFAAAAAAGNELTVPSLSQTVILARRAGRTPVPEGEELTKLASHNTTLALYLSVSDMPGVVQDLKAGGYTDDTPVVVAYRTSWPDEKIIRGTLGDIADQVAEEDVTRQAVILVGPALNYDAGENSKLYDATFSHGYRSGEGTQQATQPTRPSKAHGCRFSGRIGIFALTEAGCRSGVSLAESLGCDVYLSEKHADAVTSDSANVIPFTPTALDNVLAAHWNEYDAHILIMATGIAVRKTAPLLTHKAGDPAVVVCDENGDFAIPLIGGHISGANRLARDVAGILQGTSVITTATDTQNKPAFDEIASLQGWTIENPGTVKEINSALLKNQPIAFFGPREIVSAYYGDTDAIVPFDFDETPGSAYAAAVVVDPPADFALADMPLLQCRQKPLVVGVGCRRDTAIEEIRDAVTKVLTQERLAPERIQTLATADVKRDEAGLVEAAEENGWTTSFYPAEQLKEVPAPTTSEAADEAVGTPSVCEAAALIASEGRLLVTKKVCGNVTVAVAVPPDRQDTGENNTAGSIAAVGIGSGTYESLTGEAVDALREAEVIVGYDRYCDQIRAFFPEKRYISSGMRKEMERCDAAIDEALAGRRVALISSGDAGVYGMAGLLWEMISERGATDINFRVVPGITAALTAAAALGAPLMNDFCAISLSDLLTLRDEILRRLDGVASTGMPCVLYNPRSSKRKELFEVAVNLFQERYGPQTPCGFVNSAGRPEETTWVGVISELPVEQVNMSTLVIIGGEHTEILDGQLVTRRGYNVGSTSSQPKQ